MQVALHVSGKEVALKEFHHEHETDVKGDSKVIILGIQKAGAIRYWERNSGVAFMMGINLELRDVQAGGLIGQCRWYLKP